MAWKWYSVKCLHETSLSAPPLSERKLGASSRHRIIEERIVLVRARTFEEAIRKAEKDAKNYLSNLVYANRFGQTVRTRYLGLYNAYIMDCDPEAGAELYSDTRLVDKTLTRRQIAYMFMAPARFNKRERKLRALFEP